MLLNVHPLVSCIMPTRNRRRFVPLAVEYFLRQDYANRELIVVDDGSDPVGDLIPPDERIRYIRLDERLTVGAKRNLANEHARGEIIAHWDDDDWHAPHRLRYQVESLLREDAEVCGINRLLFYDIEGVRAWLYVYPLQQRLWLSGSSLCYHRDFWMGHHFANVNIGEDAIFVWNGQFERTLVLADPTFHVGMIHRHNVSPKQTSGAYWQPYPVAEVRQLLGTDWERYRRESTSIINGVRPSGFLVEKPLRPIRNVFACLVHESQECIVDLVRNLRYLDPDSTILLYNGGQDPRLLDGRFPFERFGAVVIPQPRPLVWGRLHDFALDSMRFALDQIPFDTLTIVDSDQLALGRGYSSYLASALDGLSGVGSLVNVPEPQPPSTRVGPAMAAYKEIDLWRPFFRRFRDGERKFAHWSFWPATVFTADAAHDLTHLFASDTHLHDIMSRTQIWATEEVILPTLVALLGHKIVANPCSYDYVRYRVTYSIAHVDAALARPDVFWIHPVARRYDDRLRKHIRARFNQYELLAASGGPMSPAENNTTRELLLTLPILARMRGVEGWLEEDEADLLIAATDRALRELGPLAVVEIGSYCGRSTVVLGSVVKTTCPEARVYAIDPHDGKVGALDQGIITRAGTLERFKRNVAAAGLASVVEIIQKHSFEVSWDKPIGLLLIDGLHDYTSVARDFFHFESHVVPGGLIAFHDYADYYPGVKAFVHEMLRTGTYTQVRCVRSMMVVQKQPVAALVANEGPTRSRDGQRSRRDA